MNKRVYRIDDYYSETSSERMKVTELHFDDNDIEDLVEVAKIKLNPIVKQFMIPTETTIFLNSVPVNIGSNQRQIESNIQEGIVCGRSRGTIPSCQFMQLNFENEIYPSKNIVLISNYDSSRLLFLDGTSIATFDNTIQIIHDTQIVWNIFTNILENLIVHQRRDVFVEMHARKLFEAGVKCQQYFPMIQNLMHLLHLFEVDFWNDILDDMKRSQKCTQAKMEIHTGRVLYPKRCWRCFKKPGVRGKSFSCGRCNVARYCGEQCQAIAWHSGHKRTCRKI